jgi:4-hydroxyphenylacetate 3-monooxygenase
MFYAGASFVTKGHSFRCYDWAGSTDMVDRVLGQYSLEESLTQASPAAGTAHAG